LVVLAGILACSGLIARAEEEPAKPAEKAAPAAKAAQEPAPAAPAKPEAPAPAASAKPAAPPVDEVKIIVDNKAKSDGEIRFAFTPAGGTTQEIRVTVAKGMGPTDICKDIAKELKVALGEKYKVDQYDSDKIKVVGKDHAKFN